MWFTEQVFFNVKRELVEDSLLQRFAHRYPASEDILKPLAVFIVLKNHYHNHHLLIRILQFCLPSSNTQFQTYG